MPVCCCFTCLDRKILRKLGSQWGKFLSYIDLLLQCRVSYLHLLAPNPLPSSGIANSPSRLGPLASEVEARSDHCTIEAHPHNRELCLEKITFLVPLMLTEAFTFFRETLERGSGSDAIDVETELDT